MAYPRCSKICTTSRKCQTRAPSMLGLLSIAASGLNIRQPAPALSRRMCIKGALSAAALPLLGAPVVAEAAEEDIEVRRLQSLSASSTCCSSCSCRHVHYLLPHHSQLLLHSQSPRPHPPLPPPPRPPPRSTLAAAASGTSSTSLWRPSASSSGVTTWS